MARKDHGGAELLLRALKFYYDTIGEFLVDGSPSIRDREILEREHRNCVLSAQAIKRQSLMTKEFAATKTYP